MFFVLKRACNVFVFLYFFSNILLVYECMVYWWKHNYKHLVAKWWWSPLLLLVICLLTLIVIDWETTVPIWAIIVLILVFRGSIWEPNTLLVQKRYFDLPCKAKIALISDLHLGVYKKQKFLAKIIRKINRLRVDYIFIAGDLTYYPNIEALDALFAPLKNSHAPVYLVLWNHDVEQPGYPIRKELTLAIEKTWARLLNNAIVHLAGFTLVWIGDYRAHEDDVSILETVQSKLPVIVLTHNPLTIKKYTDRHHVNLTLCGHTHGWQMRLPFLEKWIWLVSSKVKHSSRWYLSHNTHNFFITAWVWEVGLPMRFFSPPTIDILYLWEKRHTFSKQIKNQIKGYTTTITDILSRKKV